MKMRLGLLLGLSAAFGAAPAMAGNWGFGFSYYGGGRYFAPNRIIAPGCVTPYYGNAYVSPGWCGTAPVVVDPYYAAPIVYRTPAYPVRYYDRGYYAPHYRRNVIRTRTGIGRVYRDGYYNRGRVYRRY